MVDPILNRNERENITAALETVTEDMLQRV